MKNKGAIIFVVILIVIILACVMVNYNSNSSEEEEIITQTAETNTFLIKYEGVDITPGQEFDENAISEEYTYSEIQSCAFDGIDEVYTYSGVEITVANVDGIKTVYSVYFNDEETQTEEGVRISDSKDIMLEKYGEDYQNDLENKYVYQRGNVELSFIIENEYIIYIEYTLITD